VIVVLVGAGGGIYATVGAGSASTRKSQARPATSVELRSFVSRTEQGLKGSFVATYEAATVPLKNGYSRGRVVAAQLSPSVFSYRISPGLSGFGATDRSVEVLADLNPAPNTLHLANAGHGIYLCVQLMRNGPWKCSNQSDVLMGGESVLLGNYPPQAFALDAQNAVCVYTSASPCFKVHPANAYFVTRVQQGQRLSCLDFGSVAKPVGYVCLDSHNLIAKFSLSSHVVAESWVSATLVSYSRSVPKGLLTVLSPPGPPIT
jgi:hypothetical protein